LIITLTTDFGSSDPYAGAMKGAILSVNPRAQIVDITHDIPAHDVERAAFVLAAAAATFPSGTVHVTVVDPGVGTDRRILAAATREHVFLAPDNGVLKYVFDGHPEARVYALDRPEYFRETVSRTFHGRDVFGPAAGHLSLGLPPEKLGTPFDGFERGTVSRPIRKQGRITGEVVSFDRYGNAITNIPAGWLEGAAAFSLRAGAEAFESVSRSYGDAAPGAPLLVAGSLGTLEISVNRGSARDRLGLRLGDRIEAAVSTSGSHAGRREA
jgi:S-adenosyl-L-methionine hydrolase (adenosine-forming)